MPLAENHSPHASHLRTSLVERHFMCGEQISLSLHPLSNMIIANPIGRVYNVAPRNRI